MRTYGRVPIDPLDPKGPKRWVKVETDAGGQNDEVYLTTLAQVLKLNLGESPFFANFGIPARNSVLQQIAPDVSVALTQQQFAGRFASLIIVRRESPEPVYDISVITHQGVSLSRTVPIPT